MSTLGDRIRAANPAPVPEAAVDRVIYESVLDKVTELEDRRSLSVVPRGAQLMRLSAAAVLLIIAVGAGYLWGSSRATVEISAGLSPTELALQYIDARNNADLLAARSILGDDVVVAEYPAIREAAELGDVFDYLAVIDERLAVLGCASPADRPETVTCEYQMDNRLVGRARAEPIPGTMRFVIADDRIVVVENAIDIKAYRSAALDPWFMWLDRRVGYSSLYRWAFQLDRAVPTPRFETLEDIASELDAYAPPG